VEGKRSKELDPLIEKGVVGPLSKVLKREQPLILEDRCQQIVSSGRLKYGRRQGLRFQNPKSRITNRSHPLI
jgi:hypothetical protein